MENSRTIGPMSLYERSVPSSDPNIQGHVYSIAGGFRWTIKRRPEDSNVPLEVLTSGECPDTDSAFAELYREMRRRGTPPAG